MKKAFIKYWKVFFFGIILNGLFPINSFATDIGSQSEALKLSLGGKIYDNWAATLHKVKPTTTHSAYPAAGKKKGGSTWRCKECHGWDYHGKDGAYRKGSHFTGIKGISAMSGKPLGLIKSVIRSKEHGYTKKMISDKALENLAYFISKGQLDTNLYIDLSSKKVKGDADRGANFFQTICTVCHGADGRKINFKTSRQEVEYVGTVANSNPWEVLHKIRNGQPGAAMISLRMLAVQDQIDIVAYTKLLPVK